MKALPGMFVGHVPSGTAMRCFQAAAQMLNFRHAAKAVGISPAGLGQQIAKLESEIGTALFLRTTRRCSLTAAGRALVPHIDRCLEEAQRGTTAARRRAVDV